MHVGNADESRVYVEMTQRGTEQLKQLRDDFVCPQCDYALRGLPGDVVTCPECGQSISITALIKRQWQGPWYAAPEYDTLALPLAWTLVCVIGAVFTTVDFRTLSVHMTAWHYPCIPLSLLVAWAIMRAVRRRFGDPDAFRLAILLHIVMILYLVGALLAFLEYARFSVAIWLLSWAQGLQLGMMIGLILLLAGVARRIEKYVGGQCIRRYLRHAAET